MSPGRSCLGGLLAVALVVAPVAPAGTAARAGRALLLHGGDQGSLVVLDVRDARARIPEGFQEDVEGAVAVLTEAFGLLREPLVVRVGGVGGALNVSYDAETRVVQMPGGGRVRNFGLDARDQLHHELAHAVVAQALPALVTTAALAVEEAVAVHEGVADFAAWLLDDDASFGEGYADDERGVRTYETTLLWPLVPGAHAKGNALTSYLIARAVPLEAVACALRASGLDPRGLVRPEDRAGFGLEPDRRPSVSWSVPGSPLSALGKYRVAPGDLIEARADDEYVRRFGELVVEVTDKAGGPPKVVGLEPAGRAGAVLRLKVVPRASEGYEKLILRYLVGRDVVGFGVLYLALGRVAP